jgi:hypothetical protein
MVLPTIETTQTEGDVETQVVLPLLTRSEYLGIDRSSIRSKEFLATFDIGKGAKTRKGYAPDYCVYVLSLPTLVVEVKAPSVSINEAWEEASLYAHVLNKRYPSRVNPCEFLFATNGRDFAAGRWDTTEPVVAGSVADLLVGSETLAALQKLVGFPQLARFANVASAGLKLFGFKKASSEGVGPTLIASKLESNSFAADLSPILRRYFSSRDQNSDPEIYKNAYVSSDEITSYDRNLESFLTDRLSRSKSRMEVRTTRRRAEEVSRQLSTLSNSMTSSGELQLITGGVGTGKSLFARRYKEFLQSRHLRDASSWAFLDFNFAPENLTDAETWVCESFVKSIVAEGAPVDLTDMDHQERVFASNLHDRASYYTRMDRSEQGRGELERARDIEAWRQDPMVSARAICRHLQDDAGGIVIVVFDNVDRRDVENQLAAFQLALWFMDQMRCLVILQMRDVTFEAHKNDPPLDTYKTGLVFHISPPRFVDVVKRRLELSLVQIEKSAPETIRYRTSSGLSIAYPRDRAGWFLKSIYLELFERTNNVSRVLEALAGRNVRKALDMFMAIITSGHMPEDLITNVVSGPETSSFPEHLIFRILMRQDYRFYSDNSGNIANLFFCDRRWERPSNFTVIEAIFYLVKNIRSPGDNGQMGFVSVERILEHLEAFGFVRDDIFEAILYLLKKDLVETDSATATKLARSDAVKATASGWAHLRILSSRAEYVGSVLPTTAINDGRLSARITDLMQIESRFGTLDRTQVAGVVRDFQIYLENQFQALKVHPGYSMTGQNGAAYILGKIAEALAFERTGSVPARTEADWLDL